VSLSACTIERRDDLPEPVIQLLEAQDSQPDESALVHQTLAIFREAVEDGDVSLALRLVDRDARLMDDLVDRGDPSDPSLQETRGLQLLALRRAHEAGLTLELIDTELVWVDEVAMITSLLRSSIEPSGDAPSTASAILPPPGWVRESALLHRTPDGWRILHLHRSTLPDARP
jgi:ketosteroid isomerase-like protein